MIKPILMLLASSLLFLQAEVELPMVPFPTAESTAAISSPGKVSKIMSDFSPLGSGLNDDCYAIEFDSNGNLYAAGGFTTAGGNAANNVAMWNGSAWSTLGAGTNGTCLTMEIDNADNVYVGGVFTVAGGFVSVGIAKWDGIGWSALGTSLNNACTDIIFDNAGNLYACGRFTTAGGVAANHIAMWDGTTWSALGTGLNGDAEALAIDNAGNIYVAGSFTMAGGVAANRMAVWDGANWAAVGTGFNATCYEIFIENSTGDIFAAGNFTTAGGVAADRIARWDGTTWAPVGTGFDGLTWELTQDAAGNIYAGGFFTTADGNPALRIAFWDGTTWTQLGPGLGNSVAALTISPAGILYVGGDFSTLTPTGFANRITAWCVTVLPIELAYFESQISGNAVQLNWAKADEDGSTDFQLEHSMDQNQWHTLTYEKSRLPDEEENVYSYLHQNPSAGMNYYRLKMVDGNGGVDYSEELSVFMDQTVEAYPVPARSTIRFANITFTQAARLKILDIQGRLVREEIIGKPEVNVSDLSPGVYSLYLNYEGKSSYLKIVKE